MTQYGYKTKNEMDLTTDDFIEYMCENIESKRIEKINRKNTHYKYSQKDIFEPLEIIENNNFSLFRVKEEKTPKNIKKTIISLPREIII
jgi:hypothetical protein